VPYFLSSCTSFCVGPGIGLGDVTGDDRNDIVMSYGGNRPSSKIAVFAQGVNGVMQAPVSYDAYDIPEPVELVDVNLDGRLDVEGFGRREMSWPPDEVEALILYQIGALYAIAKAEGVELVHVKPHGAIYNQAAQDRELANAIARAVKRFSEELILIGLAGSGLIEAGLEVGLRVANEGFPDRNYNPDGTLVSRKESNAIIESPEEVAKHALELIRNGILYGGGCVKVDTLCLHGDHPHAAENAKLVRDVLELETGS